jgi:hypothetical protein
LDIIGDDEDDLAMTTATDRKSKVDWSQQLDSFITICLLFIVQQVHDFHTLLNNCS